MYLEGVERKALALPADQFPWSLPLFARLDDKDQKQKLKPERKLAAEVAEDEPEHHGGGRFNRKLLVMGTVGAMVVGIVLPEGIRSAEVKTTPASSQQPTDVSDNATQ